MKSSISIDIPLPERLAQRVDVLRGDTPKNKYLQRLLEKTLPEISDSLDGRLQDLHQANLEVKKDIDPNDLRYTSSQPDIKICEALGCYEAATQSIVVSAGKFGMLTLHLCHECAVRKFERQS